MRNKLTFAHAYNIILHRYKRTASNNSDHNIPPRSVTLDISFVPFSVSNIPLQQLPAPLAIFFSRLLMLFHCIPYQRVSYPMGVRAKLRVVSFTI